MQAALHNRQGRLEWTTSVVHNQKNTCLRPRQVHGVYVDGLREEPASCPEQVCCDV